MSLDTRALNDRQVRIIYGRKHKYSSNATYILNMDSSIRLRTTGEKLYKSDLIEEARIVLSEGRDIPMGSDRADYAHLKGTADKKTITDRTRNIKNINNIPSDLTGSERLLAYINMQGNTGDTYFGLEVTLDLKDVRGFLDGTYVIQTPEHVLLDKDDYEAVGVPINKYRGRRQPHNIHRIMEVSIPLYKIINIAVRGNNIALSDVEQLLPILSTCKFIIKNKYNLRPHNEVSFDSIETFINNVTRHHKDFFENHKNVNDASLLNALGFGSGTHSKKGEVKKDPLSKVDRLLKNNETAIRHANKETVDNYVDPFNSDPNRVERKLKGKRMIMPKGAYTRSL